MFSTFQTEGSITYCYFESEQQFSIYNCLISLSQLETKCYGLTQCVFILERPIAFQKCYRVSIVTLSSLLKKVWYRLVFSFSAHSKLGEKKKPCKLLVFVCLFVRFNLSMELPFL